MEQEVPYNETLVSRRGNSCAMPRERLCHTDGTFCATLEKMRKPFTYLLFSSYSSQ